MISIPALCQDEEVLTAPNVLFKTTPQNFLVNTLKIGVEVFNKSRTKSYSLYLNGRLDSDNGAQAYYYDDFYQGFGAEFQYRKYLNGFTSKKSRRGNDFLQGVYFGGYLNGGTFSNKGEFWISNYDNNTGQVIRSSVYREEYILNVGTGFTIGYHRTFWKVLFFDAYLGGGVQLSTVDRNFGTTVPDEYYTQYYNGINAPHYRGIMPKIGIALGVAL